MSTIREIDACAKKPNEMKMMTKHDMYVYMKSNCSGKKKQRKIDQTPESTSLMAIVQCHSERGIDHDLWYMYVHGAARRGDRTRDRERIKLGLDCIVMSGQVNGWRGVAWSVMFMRAFLVLVLSSWILDRRRAGYEWPWNSRVRIASPPYDPSSLLVMANELSRVGATGSTSPNARHVPTKLCPPTIYPLNTHTPSPSVGCGCWCAGMRTSATSPSHSRTRP